MCFAEFGRFLSGLAAVRCLDTPTAAGRDAEVALARLDELERAGVGGCCDLPGVREEASITTGTGGRAAATRKSTWGASGTNERHSARGAGQQERTSSRVGQGSVGFAAETSRHEVAAFQDMQELHEQVR